MNTFKISILTLLSIVLFSCSSDAPKEPLIERNKDVREYINVLGELVDEYCNLLEKTMDKAVALEKKEDAGEEVNFLDGLDMIGGMATSAIKIAQLSEEIERMEKKQEQFKDDLSAADFEEFLKLYTKTLSRFYDMAKKAEKLEKDR